MIQSGRVLRLFPEQGKNGTQWYAPTDPVRALPKGDSVFIKGIFPLMYEAVRNGDSDGLRGLIDKTAAFQRERGAAGFLPEGRLKAELLYNRLDAVPWLYRIDLCCGLLAFAYFVWSLASGRRNRRIERLSLVPLAGTAVLLTVSMALRGYAAGHLPLGNGYETMIFVAWCLSLLALGIGRRFPIAAASGLLMSGFALLVASLGMANPQITPLVPVLRSPWLSLHVSLIMVSYALLGLLMLNGTAALALAAAARAGTAERTSRTLARLRLFGRLLLYPAVFLLTAGIFTGAVWANASWGRYWGWDPKEVWALITLIVYALPLHEQSLARFRRPLFFHAYTLWAFAAVLMTYFGVNYFLGGMHSYGGGFRPGYAAATVFAAVTAFALLTVAALIRQRRTDT